MGVLQRGVYSVIRKPIKSLLLLVVVTVISSFFIAGLASKSASVLVQDSTRQAAGATLRLEGNEENRHTRMDEAMKIIGEDQSGNYQGYYQEQLENGSWKTGTDNSFETIKEDDVKRIARVDGVEDYNLITVPTIVNPVNFKRIENLETDQSNDVGGVNLRGNRIMDMDVDAGKIEILEGRMIEENNKDVCVISQELAQLNDLKIGDMMEFNDYRNKENSTIYGATVIGIYKAVQELKPIMSGDSYRSENTIFTDMHFPEKPSGDEGNPLFQYAIFKVSDVDLYDQIKEDILNVDIEWSRYDLIDNNGNIETMAQNFNSMEKISDILLILISAVSFAILILIFIFWMRNRIQEIGIYMALGEEKRNILGQFLWEAMLIGLIGLLLSFVLSPILSEVTAAYLAQETVKQQEEQDAANLNQVASDAPEIEQNIQGVEIHITSLMILVDIAIVAILLFVSVFLAGIVIMRRKPKEILNEMG
ncbi:MAG TPA: ABC transporter permease [Candidatus Merdenecus merdavium]|nr:ABC transporter permease [Candidatus Merdenecus merdavium]